MISTLYNANLPLWLKCGKRLYNSLKIWYITPTCELPEVPDEGGQFCSSSSSPPASVKEVAGPLLRLRTSTLPRRPKGLIAESWAATSAVVV